MGDADMYASLLPDNTASERGIPPALSMLIGIMMFFY